MNELEQTGRSDQRLAAFVLAGTLIAAALAAWGTFGEEDFSVWDYVIVLAITLVAAGIVYAVARNWPSGRTAVVLGVLAVLTIAVFWSGLPAVLASAAIALGLGARERGETTLGSVAILLGVLALAGDIAVYIADMA